MALTKGVEDTAVQSLGTPIESEKGVGMRILRPRFSVLDIGVTILLLGATFSAIAWYRIAEDRRLMERAAFERITEDRRLMERAVFESPLPKVELAVSSPTPHPNSYKKQYQFTTDWFTRNIPVWEKALAPYRGKADVRYLEIGVFEGRSALWAMENILTHPTARLTCIDLFNGPYKDRFLANLEKSGDSGKVTAITDYSQLVLRKMPLDHFDIIYIDGSHAKEDVLEDAVLSWRLLKDGGVMIFDDYQWVGFYASGTSDAPTDFCKTAIDRFIQSFDRHFEVIHNSYQIILRKVRPKPS
jgi:predicted O-methyltransferase YrrM